MVQSISLDIPDSIVRQAQQLASQSQQRPEDILLEWLTHSFIEHPVETLPDSQVLALCNMQLDEQQQATLNSLLDKQREDELTPADNKELQFLMKLYRRGLLRKAKALKLAVERGLIPPLNAA
ncbi:hypothetical protein [cf. Phormidesmis sp. LEGE 11477]|uniref:hypothetical protein n=1 Tax=cf. Phormidesmis sp. LEGE 11477 TaxID=1828680 RepID=UPI0018823885|nr:hypothetical protein [cf. Phormidesmis sp. LEGE 11477]MBE9061043.1 hypothetical protein [cf. Phormidesmis sp. LEGE 11477]